MTIPILQQAVQQEVIDTVFAIAMKHPEISVHTIISYLVAKNVTSLTDQFVSHEAQIFSSGSELDDAPIKSVIFAKGDIQTLERDFAVLNLESNIVKWFRDAYIANIFSGCTVLSETNENWDTFPSTPSGDWIVEVNPKAMGDCSLLCLLYVFNFTSREVVSDTASNPLVQDTDRRDTCRVELGLFVLRHLPVKRFCREPTKRKKFTYLDGEDLLTIASFFRKQITILKTKYDSVAKATTLEIICRNTRTGEEPDAYLLHCNRVHPFDGSKQQDHFCIVRKKTPAERGSTSSAAVPPADRSTSSAVPPAGPPAARPDRTCVCGYQFNRRGALPKKCPECGHPSERMHKMPSKSTKKWTCKLCTTKNITDKCSFCGATHELRFIPLPLLSVLSRRA